MTLLSPGIENKEINLASAIGRAATGRAAMVGKFEWGPAYSITQVTSESDLVTIFGRPNDYTAASFMTANNFLKYGNDLRLVRICDATTAQNATPLYNAVEYTIGASNGCVVGDDITITYSGVGALTAKGKVLEVDAGNNNAASKIFLPSAEIVAAAKADGNYPSVGTITLQPTQGDIALTNIEIIDTGSVYFPNIELAFDALTAIETEGGALKYADLIEKQGFPRLSARYVGDFGDAISVEIINYADYQTAFAFAAGHTLGDIELPIYPDGGTRSINLSSYFTFGPSNSNQYAVIVRVSGEVEEAFIVSTNPGDKDVNGQSIFIDEYFENSGSAYITAIAEGWKTESGAYNFGGGSDANAGADDWMFGLDMLSDPEVLYTNLVIAGNAAAEEVSIASTVQKYAIDSVGNVRQDCVVFVSPPQSLIVNKQAGTAVANIQGWRTGIDPTNGQAVVDNLNVSTTYAVIDGNYKYQYDKYNDRNRWVPLAGDIAGLCAYTDQVSQPWMSPAGFNRGQIKGVNRLAVDLRRAHRDALYQIGINPVVGFAGQGFVLYGDKTATQQASAFDRINVRRLFNLLKKAISDAAKYRLFELNDEFTRSSFKSEIDAYLTNIQDLGGIYDFRVVCDETNNPGSVIDRNEFVASIYVKPAKSINFITLNFVATSTDADFAEIIG
ncbi:tail sheath protein [Vibrio phage V05]|uniref:Tail sheath protein n=1 Tax=Vibrio phage V09 TaxID=2724327 RepID=A0A6H0X9F7_9CAUD|nr:tail sheath protein [Vibrio phage V05]QIW91059.1 tail sheath protein [Vibrio phage V09]